MNLDIRAFLPEDHAQAWSVWQRCEGIGLSNADSFANVERFLKRNPGLSFVAVDEEAIVATVLCGHDGRRGLIHHLAVVPSHRRKGLGRALLERALAALRQEGVEKAHLLIFRENAAGRAFWQSVGAEERVTLALFSIGT